MTYGTVEPRYSVASDSGVGWRRWRLLINGSQVEDQGQYRCQVATQPPKILAVTLVVTALRATASRDPEEEKEKMQTDQMPPRKKGACECTVNCEATARGICERIVLAESVCIFAENYANTRRPPFPKGQGNGIRDKGGDEEPLVQVVDERGTKVVDKHYNSGSMIELKCVIEKVPFPHLTVNWLRGSTVLSFNTSRGGISVKGDAASGFIRSRLYVADASPADSGLYSCWYGNYTSDTVSVHVIAGENSAAMQHDALPDGATASGAPSLHCPDHLYQLLIPVLSSWSLPNVIAAFTTWLLSSQSFWINKIIGATR
nr:uncharacterized protein LOC113826668 [Penaeus vannamei]